MKKISVYPRKDETQVSVFFICPGCKENHMVLTGDPSKKPNWGFNGDVEKPTITPSILVQWEYGPERTKNVCHSYITDGKIQFLGDCTHDLKNQTVELPECNL